MKVLTLVLGLVLSTNASAGWSSGGSNALVCFENNPEIVTEIRNSKKLPDQVQNKHLDKITKIENLDLVEARLEKGDGVTPKIIQVLDGETPTQYVERIANRFEYAFPAITRILRQGLNRFKAENIYRRNHPLYRIDDAKEVGPVDPEHCLLTTIARQEDLGKMDLLHLDKRLFELSTTSATHSVLSKAVTLLHENIYWTARKKAKQYNSKMTRLQVAALIRSDLTLRQIIEVSAKLGIAEHGKEVLDTDKWSYRDHRRNKKYAEYGFGENFAYVNKQLRSYLDVMIKAAIKALKNFEEKNSMSETQVVVKFRRFMDKHLNVSYPACDDFETCHETIKGLAETKSWEDDDQRMYTFFVYHRDITYGTVQRSYAKTYRDPNRYKKNYPNWLKWIEKKIAKNPDKRIEVMGKAARLAYHEKVKEKLFKIPYLTEAEHLELEKNLLGHLEKVLEGTRKYRTVHIYRDLTLGNMWTGNPGFWEV